MHPFLHDLVSCVRAPAVALGGRDGQIRPSGAHGLHWLDRRHLSELTLTVDGHEPTAIGHSLVDPWTARFVATVSHLATGGDPTVMVERLRTVGPGGLTEDVTIANGGPQPVAATVVLRVAADLVPLPAVRSGRGAPPAATTAAGGPGPGPETSWSAGTAATTVRAAALDAVGPALTWSDDGADPAGAAVVTWPVALAGGERATLRLAVECSDNRSGCWFAPSPTAPWDEPMKVSSACADLDRLVAWAVADVAALTLRDGADPFAAAGSPWFLTMFGRDSLWTARFMLPLGTELAAGTLRALARRQATQTDADISAEPGKILHEVRLDTADLGDVTIPPLYYGAIDATALWISLLHDAWVWGLAEGEVAALLPPLERAVAWIVAQRDERGLLSYRDPTGRRLANQGWKDSGDAIVDAEGRLATAPITLCEVQAYAYRALGDAARLLRSFGRPGAAEAEAVAAELATSFRTRFWVGAGADRFPAVALDHAGRRVDSLTSNIGHLLGTGLLDSAEEAVVAARLGEESLAGGHGLRTLAGDHPRFNPLGYHCGAIWPHDTAIAVAGLVAAGHPGPAADLARGVVEAAAAFEHRLPELYGGWPRQSGGPFAYPAACRPQAWAAAAPVALVGAALGLGVDRPGGGLTAAPDPAFAWLFPLEVTGVRAGGATYDVNVDGAARATVTERPR